MTAVLMFSILIMTAAPVAASASECPVHPILDWVEEETGMKACPAIDLDEPE